MKTVVITTLGCKVNQYESASFDHGFAERGLQLSAKARMPTSSSSIPAPLPAPPAPSRAAPCCRPCAATPGQESSFAAAMQNSKARFAEDERLAGREVLFVGNSAKDQLVSLALATPTPHPLQLGDIAAGNIDMPTAGTHLLQAGPRLSAHPGRLPELLQLLHCSLYPGAEPQSAAPGGYRAGQGYSP
jgi:hypothetical protein